MKGHSAETHHRKSWMRYGEATQNKIKPKHGRRLQKWSRPTATRWSRGVMLRSTRYWSMCVLIPSDTSQRDAHLHRTGWAVLGNPHCLQCAVVSAAPARGARSRSCCTPADFRTTQQLLRPSSLREFYTRSVRASRCSLPDGASMGCLA